MVVVAKKRLILILACLSICLLFNSLYYYFRYLPLKKVETVHTIQKLQTAYQVIIDEYQRSSRLIYDHITTTAGFFSLYQRANSTNEQIKNRARNDLFTMFAAYYQTLAKNNIRDLHFHLPNCDSFLRFHKPQRFGDNLKSIRYSLLKANRDLVDVVGFEEGRVKNGFRYVFPLIHAGKHLGSVEISLGFSAIEKELRKLYNNDYAFILKKSIIDSKLFQTEKSFYKNSHISPNFVVEKGARVFPVAAAIDAKLVGEIQDALQAGLPFVKKTSYAGEKYVVTFLPIVNVKGEHVAYIISYEEDKSLLNLNSRFLITSSLFGAFVVLAFISFAVITEKNQKLAVAVADRRKAMEFLRGTESNFKRVFHNTQDAILLLEEDVFIDCNDTVVKMLGAKNKEQIINTHPAEISPPQQPDGQDSAEKAVEIFAQVRKKGFHRFEWELKKINGDVFPVMVSLSLLLVQGKEQIHVHWHDLSKQKQYEQHLQEIAEQAKAASLAKDTFLANMSHEIRTPMNGVLGLASLLQEMKLGTQAEELISKLIYSAQSLLGLLNDILDFSKIEAGQLSLEERNFSLATMVNGVLSCLDFMAVEKGLTLKDNSDYVSLPIWVRGDDMRLKQVLTNLIGNAIKFTDRGDVTVKVKSSQTVDGAIMLRFTVADTGIGIPQSKQQQIFSSFTQAESSTARQFGGTGLGLAISKQLVEMMGGEIGCNSKLGEGTVFHFTVTVEPGSEEIMSVNGPRYSCCNNLRILLAEDNVINQQIAVAVLEQDNHTVEVAENGLEALTLLSNNDYDLIIMDVQMPKMDGLLATAIIRKCEAVRGDTSTVQNTIETKLVQRLNGCHVPILAMTANAMSGDREKCLSAGMDYYITKPFMPEDIHVALNMLELSSRHESVVRGTGQEYPVDTKEQVVNHLIQVYDLEDKVATKLVIDACESLSDLQKELDTASSENNVAALLVTVQKLKGIFLNLGLKDIADLIEAVVFMTKTKNTIDQKILGNLNKKIADFIS